ncbi:MAG: tetratricopeptide repeat protein [Promethearchaeota archaeon]
MKNCKLCNKEVAEKDLSFYHWYQENKHLANKTNPKTGQMPFLYYRYVGFPNEGVVCNQCMEKRMMLEENSKKLLAEMDELSKKIYSSNATGKICGICGNKAIYFFSSITGGGPEAVCGICVKSVLRDAWNETYTAVAQEWFDRFQKINDINRNARLGYLYSNPPTPENIQKAITETEEVMAQMKKRDPFIDVTDNYSYTRAIKHREDLLKQLEEAKIKEKINQKRLEAIELIDKKEFQRALPIIQEVIKGEGNKNSEHLLFRVYNELGEYDKIEEESIKNFNSSRDEYWSEVLWKFYKTNNSKSGMDLAKKLLKKGGNPRAWYAYLSLLKEEKPKALNKELSKALKKFPDDSLLNSLKQT